MPSVARLLSGLSCLLAICALLAVSGCMSSGGYGNAPWSAAQTPAQGAPDSLTTPPPAPENRAGTTPGPNDYANVFGDTLYGAQQQQNATQQQMAAASTATGATYESQAPAPQPPAFAPVKVGLLLPSSGKNAETGQAMLKAAQMAVFDLGYAGFELVPRDTGDSPDGAARAAREALSAGAQILIGPLTAPAARAVQPVARAANVNMLTFSTDWTLAGQNTYIMGFLPFSQVRRIAAFAAQNGMRSVAVIAPENDYGAAILSSFSAQAPAFGMRSANIVRIPANGVGMSEKIQGLVAQSASSPFDAVLIAAGGETARAVSDALTGAGLGPDRVARLGTGLWDDSMTAASGALDGAWFAAPAPRARSDFEHKYAGLYGVNPPRLATLAYDATALTAVLARSAPQGAAGGAAASPFTRTALLNPNGFAGLDGIFRFRNDGLVERGDAVLTFRNRSITEASPAPESFQAQGY